VETYSKEALGEEIRKFTAANVQLVNDKLNIEAAKTKLETDKIRLINKKNILIAKREELRAELTEAIVALITNVQTPVIIVRDKLKVKRLLPFDKIKKMFQRFFTGTRYYHGFYNQNLSFDLDKV